MTEAANGAVWISDGLNRLLAVVDADGKNLRVVARQGEGPGEVGAPTMLASTAAGGVAVYDLGHSSVEIFGRDSRFKKRIPLERRVDNPKGFVVHPSGDFILSGGIGGNGHSIHSFRPDGGIRASWYRIPRTVNPRAGVLIAGGPLHTGSEGWLLFSQAAPHRILFYPGPGREPQLIAADAEILEPIGDNFVYQEGGKQKYRWWYPQSKGVFRFPDGSFLNVIRFRDQESSIWEIYSPNGESILRKKVRRAYEPWALARNGDILASYVDPATDEHVAARLRIRYSRRDR
jgi:hypothetical protein